jgi:MFS family permease
MRKRMTQCADAAVATHRCRPRGLHLGIVAPMIIVLARLSQGFATGGEFSSATTILVEIDRDYRIRLRGVTHSAGCGPGGPSCRRAK